MTDAITGMSSGTIAFAEDNIAKIDEAARRAEVPLDDLPVATYDGISRKFTYVEETKGGAE